MREMAAQTVPFLHAYMAPFGLPLQYSLVAGNAQLPRKAEELIFEFCSMRTVTLSAFSILYRNMMRAALLCLLLHFIMTAVTDLLRLHNHNGRKVTCMRVMTEGTFFLSEQRVASLVRNIEKHALMTFHAEFLRSLPEQVDIL
jgi:hypothetical protein